MPTTAVRASKADKAQDTSTWLTRNEASDLLGCSIQSISNYERRGKLHPARAMRVDGRGTERLQWVYDPRELAKLPNLVQYRALPRPPGEMAARAFELFAQEVPLCDVVVELRETPDHIRSLHEQWLDMRGARFVLSDEARDQLKRRVGSFANVAELIERIDQIKPQNAEKGTPT